MRVLILLALSLTACVDRALDPAGTAPASADLAGADLRGVDLAGVDLARPLMPGVDLATSAQIGVQCGAALCAPDEACCIGMAQSKCIPAMGPGGGGPGGCLVNMRCDGPEDCANGRVCVGSETLSSGAPFSTRCRRLSDIGSQDYILCHSDADCVQGGACGPVQVPLPDAPMISICN